MVAFARDQGLLTGEGAWKVLAGGVSSDIWRVASDAGEYCIKRALPELKVAALWEAPVERNAFEWAYMQTVSRIAPGSVPQPVAHDCEQGLFAMAFLDPSRYPLWKTLLFAGQVDQHFAQQVGDLVGRIHASTADDFAIARNFATDDAFQAIRIDPYLLETTRRHPDLAPVIIAVAEETATTRHVLVHGDVSPKNILAGPSGPVLLDAECAWYGDPAFDLAFCLNHLVIKSRVLPSSEPALAGAFERLSYAYFACVDWEPVAQLELRASRLLAVLALARVDGKSPVEYLDDAQADGLRRAARAAVAADTPTLAETRRLLLNS